MRRVSTTWPAAARTALPFLTRVLPSPSAGAPVPPSSSFFRYRRQILWLLVAQGARVEQGHSWSRCLDCQRRGTSSACGRSSTGWSSGRRQQSGWLLRLSPSPSTLPTSEEERESGGGWGLVPVGGRQEWRLRA
jgi:hypothetical protein